MLRVRWNYRGEGPALPVFLTLKVFLCPHLDLHIYFELADASTRHESLALVILVEKVKLLELWK